MKLPPRNIPHNERLLVSPANGTIVSILPWSASSVAIIKGSTGRIRVWTHDVAPSGYIISIHLSLTDEHVQRAPLASQILYSRHTRGSFHNALSNVNKYGIRFENEHNEILLTTGALQYKVVQIAGLLARRVISYVKSGQYVNQGDVIGAITFGSQVSVILPASVQVCARVGQCVTDGESVLAFI